MHIYIYIHNIYTYITYISMYMYVCMYVYMNMYPYIQRDGGKDKQIDR